MTKTLEQTFRSEIGLGSESDDYIQRNYPSYFRIIAAIRAQANDGAGEIPLINVTRTGLITAVQARVDAINAAFAEAAAKLDAEDAARASWKTAMAAYHTAMSKAWKGDDYEVNTYYAELNQKDGGKKLPEQPSRPRSEDDVKSARTKLETDRAKAVAELEGQLAVLTIGSDEAVAMRGVSVESLLKTPVPANLTY